MPPYNQLYYIMRASINIQIRCTVTNPLVSEVAKLSQSFYPNCVGCPRIKIRVYTQRLGDKNNYFDFFLFFSLTGFAFGIG